MGRGSSYSAYVIRNVISRYYVRCRLCVFASDSASFIRQSLCGGVVERWFVSIAKCVTRRTSEISAVSVGPTEGRQERRNEDDVGIPLLLLLIIIIGVSVDRWIEVEGRLTTMTSRSIE